jgi:hypothetical protein
MIYWSVCAIICAYLYIKVKPSSHESRVSRKVSERSIKPLGFTKPHYFYIYNISSYDFTAIQTARAEIYLFTIGTPYKIYSRILVLASYGGGKLTVKCPSPETSRWLMRSRACRIRAPAWDTLKSPRIAKLMRASRRAEGVIDRLGMLVG